MPDFIDGPAKIDAEGDKSIEEYVGRVNTAEDTLSIAHMKAPAGWEEPGQTPEFTEYTILLDGRLRVEHEEDEQIIEEGEAVVTYPGEWVRYSTPEDSGAEYVAICLPAFGPDLVHRSE